MKGLLASVPLALIVALGVVLGIACGASDDEYRGSHAECEFGGTLTDCPNAARTVQAACWRMVDCGAIIVHDENNNNALDWDNCVGALERTTEDRRRLVIACIASSTCDELRTRLCFELGDI